MNNSLEIDGFLMKVSNAGWCLMEVVVGCRKPRTLPLAHCGVGAEQASSSCWRECFLFWASPDVDLDYRDNESF